MATIDLDVISILVEKYDLASKTYSADRTQAWKSIASDYNEETSQTKTPKQLQSRWNDYQAKLRKKASELKAYRNGTGGGEIPKKLVLSEVEQKHLAIGNSVNKTYTSIHDSENDFNPVGSANKDNEKEIMVKH